MPTLLLAAVGCSSLRFRSGALSYAQVQSIKEGQTADDIRSLLGEPQDALKDGDQVRELIYAAENPDGKVKTLRIGFDLAGHVSGWTLGQKDRAK